MYAHNMLKKITVGILLLCEQIFFVTLDSEMWK